METWQKATAIVVVSAGVLYVGMGYIDGAKDRGAQAQRDSARLNAEVGGAWGAAQARARVERQAAQVEPSAEVMAAHRASSDGVWAEYDGLPGNLKNWTAIYVYSVKANGALHGLPAPEQKAIVQYNGLQFRKRLGPAMTAGEVGEAHGDELRSYTPSKRSVDRCRQLASAWLASDVAGKLRDQGVTRLTCGAQSWAI